MSLAASLGAPAHASAGTPPTKVAIIVGPVGSLTPTYLHLAELAATQAERLGATVARAYSPNATPANVLAAVEGAHVVVYFGHGYGHPSPYGGLNTARQNGWGLQGPGARGTHADGLNGEMAYYGEDWIVANARPAPGFVMIYSNVCYAPGASEGGFPAATEPTALGRVAHYSRKVFRMGGSAYFATDFDRGAADLVRRIVGDPQARYGAVFAGDSRYVPAALRTFGHPFVPGQQVWLHRTKYTDGPPNYWYAFAGNPDAVAARSWDPIAPTVELLTPVTDLGPAAEMRLRTSEPVVGLGSERLVLTDDDGAVVPTTASIDEGDPNEIVVRPAGGLSLSGRYQLSVAAGATDRAGNALAATAWSLTTRLDADAADALTVVLGPRRHELVRIGPDGSIAERRTLDVVEERWMTASRRARLPGSAGSWLELSTGDQAGWWVAESSGSRVPGTLDVATFGAPQRVELPVGEFATHRLLDGAWIRDADLAVRASRSVLVDRRAVVDGVLRVRVAGDAPGLDGRWLELPTHLAPDEAAAVRVLADEPRSAVARIGLALGDWTLLRFDPTGVVVDRRVVSGGRLGPMATSRTLDVGGTRFHVLDEGEHAGWAVRDDARHRLILGEAAPASAD